MATNQNIQMQHYNGTDYDPLFPYTLTTNVKDANGNLLSDLIRPIAGVIAVSQYSNLAVNGDMAPAINKALGLWNDNTSPFYQKHYAVILDATTYTIKQSINYNPKYVALIGNQATIQTSGIGNTFYNAIEVNTGDTYSDPMTSQKVILDIYLKGEGKSVVNSVGVNLTDAAGIRFSNLRVDSFETNVRFNGNTYLVSFDHCNFPNAKTAVLMPSGQTNTGERLTFIDCNLGNSDYAFDNELAATDVYFTNCSFDYVNNAVMKLNGGLTVLDGCHIENNLSLPENPFQVNGDGSTLLIKNSYLLFQGSTLGFTYVVSGNGHSALEDCFIHNCPVGQFFEENGDHVLIRPNTYNTTNNFSKVNDASNLLNDGHFYGTAVSDLIWVNGDTGALTDRLTGVNIQISVDTANGKSGTNSLKIVKKDGTGSVGAVSIAVPLNDKTRKYLLHEWYYQKNNSAGAGGTVNVNFDYVYLVDKGKSVAPEILKQTQASNSGSYTFGAGITAWTMDSWGLRKDGAFNPPAWATHFMVTFNLYNYDGSNGTAFLNFDDIYIAQV